MGIIYCLSLFQHLFLMCLEYVYLCGCSFYFIFHLYVILLGVCSVACAHSRIYNEQFHVSQ